MPRAYRVDFPNAWHHVMNRGAGRAEVFNGFADYSLFLECVAQASARYAVEIHAYCLMSNHYHLLVRSHEGRLAEFMRFGVGRFTRVRNSRHASDGPLFRGRYASKLIASDAHLLECIRYIHLNPVEAKLSATPETWVWSSARAYLGLDPSTNWLITQHLLELFGPHDKLGAYKKFMQDGAASMRGVRPRGSDTKV